MTTFILTSIEGSPAWTVTDTRGRELGTLYRGILVDNLAPARSRIRRDGQEKVKWAIRRQGETSVSQFYASKSVALRRLVID